MNEILANFHFLRPVYLFLLPVGLALAFLLWRSRGSEISWSRVVSPELLPHLISRESVRRSRSGIPALLAAWCLGSLAAAGPSWEQIPQPVLQKQDALVVMMDLSYSMLATDLEPSRQDRVRRKLLDLLRDRDEGLTALVAYAGDAHIVAPLTDDNPTIANLLPALTPEMMPLPGSNPSDAVARALELLDSAGVLRGRLLLVSDGITDADAGDIVALLEGTDHALAVLGVGTEVGAPIALPGGGFLKDEDNEIVVPALDERTLSSLADRLGGRYERMRVDDSDLQTLLDDSILINESDTISLDRRADQWQDMAHWFVLPLLLAALASFRRGWVYVIPLAAPLLHSEDATALEWKDLWLRADQQAQALREQGDSEAAAARFRDPQWRGVAAFESEQYEEAEKAFADGADADALYNLGNALAGQNRLDEAIAAYEQSLELAPDREDARKNIETLKRIQDQQQQQSQQGDSQQQDQQQNQQQQQQQQQDGQNGDSESQEQDQQQQQGGNSQQSSDAPPGEEPQQDPNETEADEEQQSEPENSEQQGEQDEREGGQPMPQPQIDTSAMQEDMERDQAMQQWLRRVPDDPSGLLREKFRYESRLRQQQGEKRDTKKIW